LEEVIEVWAVFVENANAVIAIFTGVLVIVTIVYAVVTWRMLRQSRNVFLADLFYRLVERLENTIKEAKKEGVLKDWASPEGRGFLWSMVMGGFEALRSGFAEIDKKLANRLEQAYRVGLKKMIEQYNEDLKVALAEKGKWEAKMQELEEKIKQLEEEPKKMSKKRG